MNQKGMWIMIAGPYKAGAKSETDLLANLNMLNRAATELFRRGHTPIIGVNMALPMIHATGSSSYTENMMPLSLRLCDRCDAILRIGGESEGADQEVSRFKEQNKIIFRNIEEIPNVTR